MLRESDGRSGGIEAKGPQAEKVGEEVEEPLLQDSWEEQHSKAHAIFQPTPGDLTRFPRLKELEGAAVAEREEKPFYLDPRAPGIPIKSTVRITFYETTFRVDKSGRRICIEHNLGSKSSHGSWLSEEELERATVDSEEGLVVGPAYEIVEEGGIKFPRRMVDKYALYREHTVKVDDETATKFRPWAGKRIN